MKRNEWNFTYAAGKLAEAAQGKLDHHNDRLTFWKRHKEDVISRIRTEGIEVDENVSLSYRRPKERDWDRGAKVMVRNDLQHELDEALEKLGYHTGKIAEYDGWRQVLAANADSRLELDIDDWLFFFAEH